MIFVHIVKSRFKKLNPSTSSKKILLVGIALFVVLCCIPFVVKLCKKLAFESKLKKISPQDRVALDSFFRILLLEECGAYVLFGSKPAAFTRFSNSQHSNFSLHRMFRIEQENKMIREGWKVWEKYAEMFESDRYILRAKQEAGSWVEIFLMNKKKCEEIIRDNLKDFQNVLGFHVTPEGILREYMERDQPVFDLLHEHHALLGILLGFGTKNSWLFHETTDLNVPDANFLGMEPLKKITPHSKLDPRLKSVFNEKNHRKCYKFLYLPYFFADLSSKETRNLQRDYLKQQRRIHQAYSDGNFLEITLRQFCLS